MNTYLSIKLRHLSLISNLLLSGLFVSHVAFADTTLNSPTNRITDQAIKADLATYAHTQQKIATLNDQGIPTANYHLSKAQCWLDVSLHEYTRNDRSAFPQEALAQADHILTALASKQSLDAHTPLINNADKLREDLWQLTASLKNAKGFSCYAKKVACAEVELVHAGNEHKQQGWRHAKPYIQIAEDLISEAVETGESCLPAKIELADTVAPPTQAVLPVTAELPIKVTEHLNLAADALFGFDKASQKDLLPEGKLKLDALAAKLKDAYTQVDKITIVGYTDRLGDAKYNQKLSERRANTVKAYLQTKGIINLIDASGRGASDQVTQCGSTAKPTKKLTDCLQANRRVTVEVSGVKK